MIVARVVRDGRLALLARGSIDKKNGRDTEVFFSARSEVLKLTGGRIEEFSGEQRHILIQPPGAGYPAWSLDTPTEYSVEIDARPSYRFSIQQRRVLRPLLQPPKKTNLKEIDPASLKWFEELPLDHSTAHERSLFGVRFEAGEPQVVYSEQCIASDLCLTLQRWRASGSY